MMGLAARNFKNRLRCSMRSLAWLNRLTPDQRDRTCRVGNSQWRLSRGSGYDHTLWLLRLISETSEEKPEMTSFTARSGRRGTFHLTCQKARGCDRFPYPTSQSPNPS